MTTANLPEQPPASIGDALAVCEQHLLASDIYFGHGTDNAWDEAVQLVLAACSLPGDSDNDVVSLPVTAAQWQRIRAWLSRRVDERMPLPYLTGRAWFAGLEFICDERALVPRSPLAELIQNDFQPWYHGPEPSRILDLCCGGGSIGITAAVYQPGARVDLADIDTEALSLAAENVAHHKVGDRVRCLPSTPTIWHRCRQSFTRNRHEGSVRAVTGSISPGAFSPRPPGFSPIPACWWWR